MIDMGEIFDITSYLKTYNLGIIQKYDTAEITQKFNQAENGALYKVLKDGVSRYSVGTTPSAFPELDVPIPVPKQLTDDDYEMKPAKLSFNNLRSTVEYKDKTYNYDYCAGVYAARSFDDVKEFLFIWQYLKTEGLVLEVENEITALDVGVFFYRKPILPAEIAIDNQYINPLFNIFEYTPVKNAFDYVDFTYEYNYEWLKICSEFIGRRIIPNPKLILFIKYLYRTKEQLNFMSALIPAYLAIIVSGIILFIPNQDNNIVIQNQLADIQNAIQSIEQSNQYLYEISEELKSIKIEQVNNYELKEKLNQIYNLIQTIINGNDDIPLSE